MAVSVDAAQKLQADRTVLVSVEGKERLLTRLDGTPYQPAEEVDAFRAVAGAPPFLIVEFLSADTTQYVSLFDGGLRLVCENLQFGDVLWRQIIGHAAAPALNAAIQHLLRPPENRPLFPFEEASVSVRKLLAHLACEHARPPGRRFDIGPDGYLPPVYVTQGGRLQAVSREACIALFKKRSADLFSDFASGQPMKIRDLCGDWTLELQHVVCMSEVHYAYCFDHTFGGHDVVVFVSVHHSAVMGVYFPESDIAIYNTMESDVAWECRTIVGYIGYDARTSFLLNLFGYLPWIKQVSESSPVYAVVRERHLGHHLWNEMGGMQELLDIEPRRPVRALVTADNESEVFGRLDDVFPELSGRVWRANLPPEKFNNLIHRHNAIPIRYTTRTVGRGIAARIMLSAERLAPEAAKSSLETARTEGRTIVLLGIRLQDRTLDDPLAFFRDTVLKLKTLTGPLLVVVDGYNAPNEGVEQGAFAQEMVDRETDFVTNLVDALAQHDVKIVSTIGASMAASIFWSANCDFFVSLWGAGLAKYRWIANKQGVIVSGRWNIESRYDFQIYETDQYMTEPTAVIYPPASIITDIEPEAAGSRSDQPESLWNFKIDPAGWADFLKNNLGRIWPAGAR